MVAILIDILQYNINIIIKGVMGMANMEVVWVVEWVMGRVDIIVADMDEEVTARDIMIKEDILI